MILKQSLDIGLRETKPEMTHCTTNNRLDIARAYLEETNNKQPSDEEIVWHSLSRKHLNESGILFGSVSTMPTNEENTAVEINILGEYHICNAEENIDHILAECQSSSAYIWCSGLF